MRSWFAFLAVQVTLVRCQTSLSNKGIRSLLLQRMATFSTFKCRLNSIGLDNYTRLMSLLQRVPWFFKWHVFFLNSKMHLTFYIWITILPQFPYSQCSGKRILVQQELQGLQV